MSFEDEIARELGRSSREQLRTMALEQGLDPDPILDSIAIHAFVGPDPFDDSSMSIVQGFDVMEVSRPWWKRVLRWTKSQWSKLFK